jgi:diguanylate cyclase (GGDEF)-like protein
MVFAVRTGFRQKPGPEILDNIPIFCGTNVLVVGNLKLCLYRPILGGLFESNPYCCHRFRITNLYIQNRYEYLKTIFLPIRRRTSNVVAGRIIQADPPAPVRGCFGESFSIMPGAEFSSVLRRHFVSPPGVRRVRTTPGANLRLAMEAPARQREQIPGECRHPAYRLYLFGIILLGTAAIGASAFHLAHSYSGYRWLILASLTILTSLCNVRIPAINSKISVGDTLYFTNAILFGAPAGVVTAALDGLAGSIRSRNRGRRLEYALFNTASMACSAWISGNLFFSLARTAPLVHESHAGFADIFFGLGAMALSHYLANSGSVAVIVALEKGRNIFAVWKDSFLWTSITYFAGAAAAGFIALTVGAITPSVLAIAAPVLIAVYFTYKTYLEKVDEARSLAYYDSLTGLPNRVLFKERLEEALRQSEFQRQQLAVMFLDLDHFKRINDTYGHGIGDQLLKAVAARLAANIRAEDAARSFGDDSHHIVIGRFGGDEFTILIKNISNPQDAVRIAQRFLQALASPYALDQKEVNAGATIGISTFPADGSDADTLLKNADAALYDAKESGRNNYQLYSPSMNEISFEKLSMEGQLRKAILREEFEIYYQPKLDAQSRKIAGAEALIRWQHPTKGLLQASDFIPLAEETGLIKPIGEWVLKAVCAQISRWRSESVPVVPVAVNLSPLQFGEGDLARKIGRILEDAALDQTYLELELTESAIMKNEREAGSCLAELQALGMNISIDDFGTGYSSLSRLRSLNLDALKIDKSFVSNCSENADDRAIITAIVAMARSLGLKVVAEGVETERQLAFLRELGCDEIQGFYFSRPVPAPEFVELLGQFADIQPVARKEASVAYRLIKSADSSGRNCVDALAWADPA